MYGIEAKVLGRLSDANCAKMMAPKMPLQGLSAAYTISIWMLLAWRLTAGGDRARWHCAGIYDWCLALARNKAATGNVSPPSRVLFWEIHMTVIDLTSHSASKLASMLL